MSQSYNEYLNTEYWSYVSAEVKKRGGYRCQVCNSPHDLQAHHRTYEHKGNELQHLDDLICMCRRCHAIFHGKPVVVQQPQVQVYVKPEYKFVEEKILVTNQNFKKIKMTKACWHWLRDEGLNPKTSGWQSRRIGRTIPIEWMRGNKAKIRDRALSK